MAANIDILAKYGIKEVCDFTFYKLDDNGYPTVPVLYLDTLKVSTMEQTADEATAKGGKGNPSLISWDYNKDIKVTLEDALFSAKSMAIMFGNGTCKNASDYIMKTEQFTCTGASAAGWNPKYTAPDGRKYEKFNAKFFTADGTPVDKADLVSGQKYFCSFDLQIDGAVIEISADSFPGTYYCTGDTFARSEANGEDEFFQLIFPKAKVLSENTITMEAEGDPSTFSMNLHILRPANGKMVQLVKYNLVGGESAGTDDNAEIVHNHYLANASSATKDNGDYVDVVKGTVATTDKQISWRPAPING